MKARIVGATVLKQLLSEWALGIRLFEASHADGYDDPGQFTRPLIEGMTAAARERNIDAGPMVRWSLDPLGAPDVWAGMASADAVAVQLRAAAKLEYAGMDPVPNGDVAMLVAVCRKVMCKPMYAEPDHNPVFQSMLVMHEIGRLNEVADDLVFAASQRGIDASPIQKYARQMNVVGDGPAVAVTYYLAAANWALEELIQSTRVPMVSAATLPVPIRLTINTDGDVATLDGEHYNITPDAGRILHLLLQAGGKWVSSTNMKIVPTSGERPDRIIKGLPDAIRSIIESSSGKGYRLTMFD